MFPEVFTKFLQSNNIDSRIYEIESDQRYVCVKEDENVEEDDLLRDFPSGIKSVTSCPGFFKILPPFNSNVIVSSSLYQSAKIIAMDLASGIAVHRLNVEPGDHVLDLCCAPGTKLVLISIKTGQKGTVTGIDISSQRLSNTKSLAKKYKLDNVRLFRADGRTFSVKIFEAKSGTESMIEVLYFIHTIADFQSSRNVFIHLAPLESLKENILTNFLIKC